MDLIGWLEDVVAAYRIEPSERTTRRYQGSLEQRRLTSEQWENLSDSTVLRFPRFPCIFELHGIACELRQLAQIKANSEWITRMREEWSRHQPEEKEDGSACSGLREVK